MKRRYRVIVGTPLRQFTVDAENETEARDEGHRLFDAEIDENEGHPLYDSSNEIYITAQEIWNEYVDWRKNVCATLPEEDQLFSTKMNGEKVWLLEDGAAFTMLYPEDY